MVATQENCLPVKGSIVVMGSSAGALEALTAVLRGLPGDFPAPVALVVHIPADRDNSLTEVFQRECRLPVKEAEDKEALARGTVYLAPPNYHLLLEPDATMSLSVDDPVNFSRPSINVLFESAAQSLRNRVVAVVLTGANNDGARGASCIERAGGKVIVQDPATARVPDMPKATIAACRNPMVLSLTEIPGTLTHLVTGETAS